MKPRKNETKDKFISRCAIDLINKDVIASKQLGCILCSRYWVEYQRTKVPIKVFKGVTCDKKVCKICEERKKRLHETTNQ